MKVLSMKGLVEKAHGKICQDSDSSVTLRKKDGALFSSRRCHPRDLEKKPYSEKELKVQSNFTSNSKIAGAWTKANRVYKSDGKTIDLAASTEDYRKMRAAFDEQDEIMTFQAFVVAQIKDGAVVVPDVTVATSTGGSETEDSPSSQASGDKVGTAGSGTEDSSTPSTPSGSNENSGGDDVDDSDGGYQ